jgi:hypothetical protein
MPYGLSRCAWWPCKVRAGLTYAVSTTSAAHLQQWFTAKNHNTLHAVVGVLCCPTGVLGHVGAAAPLCGDNCSVAVRPVCGADGRSYSNGCVASCAGVAVSSQGYCDGGCTQHECWCCSTSLICLDCLIIAGELHMQTRSWVTALVLPCCQPCSGMGWWVSACARVRSVGSLQIVLWVFVRKAAQHDVLTALCKRLAGHACNGVAVTALTPHLLPVLRSLTCRPP